MRRLRSQLINPDSKSSRPADDSEGVCSESPPRSVMRAVARNADGSPRLMLRIPINQDGSWPRNSLHKSPELVFTYNDECLTLLPLTAVGCNLGPPKNLIPFAVKA